MAGPDSSSSSSPANSIIPSDSDSDSDSAAARGFFSSHLQLHRLLLHRISTELGLDSLLAAPRDVKLLCLQRLVRLFAYGGSSLVLVAYLEEAHALPERAVGLFMTLALAGDLCVSLALTLAADRALGRRAVLALGAGMMAGSGGVFAMTGAWEGEGEGEGGNGNGNGGEGRNYWVLLVAAVVGVISPSGSEIGPFRAVEESAVAHLTPASRRSDVYAWYSLSGWAVALLARRRGTRGRDAVGAYRAIYWGYAALGVVKLALALALSPAVESVEEDDDERKRGGQTTDAHHQARRSTARGHEAATATATATATAETEPLLGGSPDQEALPARKRRACGLLPDIGRESLSLVISLCLLFAMDALGSGVTPISWITYYFKTKFNVGEGTLGTIFCITQVLAGLSMLVASSLARRFGNIPTMVFTHLPSAIFRALIGAANNYYGALGLLLLNAATQSMDTAPRSAFLAAVIPPAERTAVMGALNVVKTASQSLGPLLAGLAAERGLLWTAFLASGALKGSYDLALLALFRNREREDVRRRDVPGYGPDPRGSREGTVDDCHNGSRR